MSTIRLPFANEITVEYPHNTLVTRSFRHDVPDGLVNQQEETEKLLVTSDTPVSIPPIPRKKRPLSLLACFLYAFIMIFCWSITAILCVRPMKGSGWHDSYTYVGPCTYSEGGMSHGFDCDSNESTMTMSQLATNDRWRRTVRVLGTIMSVAAIPVSSALCARGAVAYLQNRYPEDFPFSKVIPLADRGWMSPVIMSRAMFGRDGRKYLSWYLIIALCICALGSLIWPLQELLLTQKSVQLLVVEREGPPSPSSYVPDADIAGLSQVNSTYAIGATRAAIDTAEYWDSQPNIWRQPENACNETSTWTQSCTTTPERGATFFWPLLGNSTFVSNLASTLNTGLAVNHAFRLNSSVDCVTVEESAYPQSCSGFTTSTTLNPSSESGEDQIFKVCVPEEMTRFPWKVTRNRQDISEQLYLHFNSAAVSSLSNTSSSFTRRCTANTTAGYFQLPNNQNSTFGPILEEFDLALSDDSQMAFPPKGTASSHYPPEKLLGHAYPIPDPPDSPALGPLLTAALSLFGPSTFFSTRANTSGTENTPTHNNASITPENCTDTIPLYYVASGTVATTSEEYQKLRRCASTSKSVYNTDLRAWLSAMFLLDSNDNYKQRAKDGFTQAVFFANKANLAQAASIPDYRRIIPLDEGVQVERLFMAPAGIVVLSVIIGLHLLGLIWVSIYSAWCPTWTEVLDALAVARLRVK